MRFFDTLIWIQAALLAATRCLRRRLWPLVSALPRDEATVLQLPAAKRSRLAAAFTATREGRAA